VRTGDCHREQGSEIHLRPGRSRQLGIPYQASSYTEAVSAVDRNP
jgi:hypothetical protein